jgi:predicted nuclease of predicted toxin-antitoxin system
VKFYLDEDLSDEIAVIARGMGVDVVSSHECGRDHLVDREQLRLAAGEGRCVVTVNRDDFIDLTVEFAAQGLPHAGVLVVTHRFPPRNVIGVARALAGYATAHPNGMQSYTIDFLNRPH